MKNFFFAIVCIFFVLPQHSMAQNYQELVEVSGFPTAMYQDSLNAAALRLINAFPDTFRNQFKVFSGGFYTLQEKYIGFGYPEAFEKLRDQAAAQSPYYLLFGRQSNSKGIFTKFWVDVKIPETGIFGCMTETQKTIFPLDVMEATKSEYQKHGNVPEYYAHAEDAGMDTLRSRVLKIVACCFARNPVCTDCLTAEQTKSLLFSLGFVGMRCTVNGTLTAQGTNVVNSGGVGIAGVDLVAKLAEMVQQFNLIEGENGTSIGYITSNFNFCNNTFESVKNLYMQNKEDFDVWLHILDNPGDDDILYINFEQYFLANDETLMDLVLDSDPGAKLAQPIAYLLVRSNGENPELWLTNEIKPFDDPTNPGDEAESEEFVHIVEPGESLSWIADLYGATVNQVLAWNPQFQNNPDLIPIGAELHLFVTEIEEIFYPETPLGIEYLTKYHWMFSKDYLRSEGFMPGLIVTPPNFVYDENLSTHAFIGINPNFVNPYTISEAVKTVYKPLPIPPEGLPWWSKLSVNASCMLGYLIFYPSGPLSSSDVPYRFDTDKLIEEFMVGKQELKTYEMNDPAPVPEPAVTKTGDITIYVTYTKWQQTPNPIMNPDISNQSRLYVGRSAGVNMSPRSIVKIRDSRHFVLKGLGYKNACLDYYTYANEDPKSKMARHTDPSYAFIRGREQVVMEAVGGEWKWQKVRFALPNPQFYIAEKKPYLFTRSGNKIAGIKRPRYPISPFPNPAELWYLLCTNLAILTKPNENWNGRFCN